MVYGTEKAVVITRSSAPVSIACTEDGNAGNLPSDAVINLAQGDPIAYESYWRKMGDKCTVLIKGYESMSYFADTKNPCWFMEPKLEDAIKDLHRTVGNASVEGYHLVVGTGSRQLMQAVFYAISPPDGSKPVSVVCPAPYYPSYVEVTDFLQSGLYKWAGDAHTFDEDGPYIELVTSPNNPDGVTREPVVNREGGKVVHDLAFYWPQYTPITATADFDIMLFTASKCTGHAGSRIGWALVKDKEVAKKMIKFMEVNTIGVSKESQLRIAKILQVVADGCKTKEDEDNFFEYGLKLMSQRWERLRDVVNGSKMFSIAEYPLRYCSFTGDYATTHPSFAWMKCHESIEDVEKFFLDHKMLTRSENRFGSDPKFVRVSMMNKEEEFDIFLERLSAMEFTDKA